MRFPATLAGIADHMPGKQKQLPVRPVAYFGCGYARWPEKGELDVPGPDKPGELALAEDPADREQSLPVDEPRSRGEVYADTRQRVEGGWEPRRFEAPRGRATRPGQGMRAPAGVFTCA